jgi:hypothetical protein
LFAARLQANQRNKMQDPTAATAKGFPEANKGSLEAELRQKRLLSGGRL